MQSNNIIKKISGTNQVASTASLIASDMNLADIYLPIIKMADPRAKATRPG
jgi:hypothetical protein